MSCLGWRHNLFLLVLDAERRIQPGIRNWAFLDIAYADSPVEETPDSCRMNRQAAAVARSERQTHTELHYALRGDGGEKTDIVPLAPRHELFPHEFTFSARETVLATKFHHLSGSVRPCACSPPNGGDKSRFPSGSSFTPS